MPFSYPKTKKIEVVDDYFGVKIPDPYRWLEDDQSQETAQWIKIQNNFTFDYLNNLFGRDQIQKRLTELSNYEKYSVPKIVNGKFYFWKNDGLQNQSILYRSDKYEANSSLELVLDPNQLSNDGTVAVVDFAFDNREKYLAFATSKDGSDWLTISVLDLDTLKVLPDKVEWVKRSNISWFKDGFFYSRFPEPSQEDLLTGIDLNHKLYFHKVGTDQSQDQLFYEDPVETRRDIRCQVSSNEHILVLRTSLTETGWAVHIYFLPDTSDDLGDSQLYSKTLIHSEEYIFEMIDCIDYEQTDGEILFLTNYHAPNFQVIAVNKDPYYWNFVTLDLQVTPTLSKSGCRTVVQESKHNLYTYGLKSVQVTDKDKLVCVYLDDVCHKIVCYNIYGDKPLLEIQTPAVGTVLDLSTDRESSEFYFKFASFVNPGTIYKFDLIKKKLEMQIRPKLAFDPDDFETMQAFYKSKDGVDIPMFITYKKGVELDGNNPTWLYGYGGFTVSVLPSYNATKIAFMEKGGIYCVANIRGGGEYGQDWYESAVKFKKQNSYDDFIRASEFLIEQKYTSSEKLIIEGVSNGGLLVGACMTQRPDLYAVCLPRVGVHDMLRFQYFTEGITWASDFGLSSDSKEMFEYLLAYSPLHNCKKAKYPATLITTADHDDRVVPMHSFKFASTLQEAQIGDKPILIRIDTKSGHGEGKSLSAIIQEQTDILSFVWKNLK